MKQIITTITPNKVSDIINVYIVDNEDDDKTFGFTLTLDDATTLRDGLSNTINTLNIVNNKYWE